MHNNIHHVRECVDFASIVGFSRWHRRMKEPEASDTPDDFVALWREAVNNNSKAWNCSGLFFTYLSFYVG